MKNIAQIAAHQFALLGRAEKSALLELAFEVVKKRQNRAALGRRPTGLALEGKSGGTTGSHEGIGHQQDGLRQVQGGIGGIDREGHDGVRECDLGIFKTGALAPEQDADFLALRDAGFQICAGVIGPDNFLALPAFARGRGVKEVEVGDGCLNSGKDLRILKN